MTQAVAKQESILDRVQNLTPEQQEEVLNFIDFLQFKGQKQDVDQKKRRKWADIQGKAPYPLVGEDAQVWVSRNRIEETENRELYLRSNYED
ncbi:MAG: DUF2281 domain-containing protein [Dolichospermum sp. DET50]|nr:DUF2281 domain-containing protein [Dolichospermum sp. DET66]MBS3035636.1 DUF2281 domain-containing protein [Dolichospermum sp. DET67]MBS3040838.1 DUF2281 domain-containing protein [Dolichospermum sp. DET50]QSX67951.1 MAG: DUF2281 domain-containing protein [Dolichospermum sp. DET69]